MKNIKFLLLIAVVSIAAACSKDDSDKPVEENTYRSMMTTAKFDTREIRNNPTDVELGFEFRPLVNGNMTSVVAKLPVAKSNLIITLWDGNSNIVLTSEHFDVLATDTETEYRLPPFPLKKGHVYAISMRVKDYYVNKYVSTTPKVFPYKCGSIEILGFGANLPNVYPDANGINIFFGDVGFKFIKTE